MKLPTILSLACFVVALFDVGPVMSQTARPSQAVPSQAVSAAHQQATEECTALYGGALPEARCASAEMQSRFSRLSTVLAKASSKQPQQSSVQQSSISAYSSEPPQNTVVDNAIVVTTVRSDVVLRAGPGADFSAIGHIPGGTELETTDCLGGWCRVEFNGIAGFVGNANLGNDAAIRSSSARRAENRKLFSPKHLTTNKIVSRERSQTKPPAATNGIVIAERRDQLPGNGEKNEKPAPQLTDSERQALFDDFLKWYRDGSVFGDRER